LTPGVSDRYFRNYPGLPLFPSKYGVPKAPLQGANLLDHNNGERLPPTFQLLYFADVSFT
jgi:hypothetical protein